MENYYWVEIKEEGKTTWKGRLPHPPRLGDKIQISPYKMIEVVEVIWEIHRSNSHLYVMSKE